MDRNDDIHPNAPAGGGGPGYFRSAGPLGTNLGMDQWMHPGPLGVFLQPPSATTLHTVPDTTAHYDVKRGDSLWSISVRKFGDGRYATELARLNKILPEAILHIGQRLIVPDYQRYDLTVKYMLAQMLKNANGQEANAIQSALTRSKTSEVASEKAIEDMKKTKWYEAFRRYGDMEIANSMAHMSGIAKTEALALWFLQVRQGGPWDHKPILIKMYQAMPTPPHPFDSLSRALHFPIRGDISHEYYYDVWSNIHYGYVGTKCGLDETTLQGGAASGLPGAGDNDEGDVISVKIGIDLWKSAGFGLDADTLRRSILAQSAKYLAARQNEINSGIMSENAINVVITDNDYK